MKVFTMALGLMVCLSPGYAGDVKQILPPGVKPGGPFSPGILAGEFLYVAGQGGQLPDGKLPEEKAEQIRQCLRNVKTVVDAAGLTMDHVVYVQTYLIDDADEDTLKRVWK